jgi:hypothetical protein
MSLQFKPKAYLGRQGQAGGLQTCCADAARWPADWGAADIKNLDFNGLIPGLVSKKFDMVTVGLSATPERRKSISFSRAYVPYAQILAAAVGDTTAATIAAWNVSDKTITSLQGSTAEQLVQKTFPNATSRSFPDQNAAFLEVATGRANGIVVENYLLAQFNKSTGTSSSRSRSRGRSTSSTAPSACRRATPRSPATSTGGSASCRRTAAGQDLPVDHRRAAAADAGLPLIEQSPDLLGRRRRPCGARRRRRGGRRRSLGHARGRAADPRRLRSSSSRARASASRIPAGSAPTSAAGGR